MRLLAYGGIRFAERCQIGNWAEVQSDLLADTDRITANHIAFGVVLLGTSFVLVYRELQNVEQRGGYPYTILLDPGKDIWQRFGWNAAALAASLFLNEHDFGQILLRNPEMVTAAKLQDFVENLQPKTETTSNQIHPFIAILAAQISPRSVQPYSSNALSFDRMPAICDLAKILDAAPPAFRLGRGWLVGASAAYAQRLGATVSLDEARPFGDADAPQLIAIGEALCKTFEWLREHDLKAFLRYSSQPFHLWEDVAQVSDDAVLLHHLLTEPDDNSFQEASNKASGPLLTSVKKAAALAALNLPNEISPIGSSLVLDCCELGLIRLDRDHTLRLDRQTLLHRLHSSSLTAIANVEIPEEVLAWSWLQYVEQGKANTPERIKKALAVSAQLEKLQPQELGVAARRAVCASGLPLHDFLLFSSKLGPQFKEWLDVQALGRVRLAPNATTLLDYIAVVDDWGGEKLSELKLPLEPAIASLLDGHTPEPLKNRARKWLVAIVSSPLRSTLSFSLKNRILLGYASEQKSWSGFRWLSTGLLGELRPAPEIDEDERKMLRFELEQELLIEFDNASANSEKYPVPALQILVQELGPLPPAVCELLKSAPRPKNTGHDADMWLQNLRACQLNHRLVEVATAYVWDWLEDASAAHIVDPVKLGIEAIENVLRSLLFEELPSDRKWIRGNGTRDKKEPVHCFCRLYEHWKGYMGATLANVLRTGLRLEQARYFARRFADYTAICYMVEEIDDHDESREVIDAVFGCMIRDRAFRAAMESRRNSFNLGRGEQILHHCLGKLESSSNQDQVQQQHWNQKLLKLFKHNP